MQREQAVSRKELIEKIVVKIMQERHGSMERMSLPAWELWLDNLIAEYEQR